MLYRSGFVYDNSISVNPGADSPPYWPQTLDYSLAWSCAERDNCPQSTFPGIWSIPLNQFYGAYLPSIQTHKRSAMLRAATALNASIDQVVQLLQQNFDRAYTTNRAPYVLTLNADFLQLNNNYTGMKALRR
jgi:hypothetical protein